MTLNCYKHIIHANLGTLWAIFLSLSLLTSCSGRLSDEPQIPDEERYVNLDLHISVNDGVNPASRVFGPDDDGKPVDKYERVHTLRVVIVRLGNNEFEDGIIEHNRIVEIKDNYGNNITSSDVINDNLRFKVRDAENKKIYLFANENAVNLYTADNEIFDFFTTLQVGKRFPIETVENLLLKRDTGQPLINNDSKEYRDNQIYIPMSECFKIYIPSFKEIKTEPIMNENGIVEKCITQSLFLTRSLIKFSFSIALANTSDVQKIENCNLKGVKISNLADYGYYLPKNTTYKPDKDDDFDNYERRTIENFEVPGQNNNDFKGVSDCTFMFIDPLQISKEGDETGPLIYLPESKILSENTNYMLTLLFTDDTQDGHFESKPLEIRDIPRNTHVKINITLKKFNLDATVTVLPYTGVWLNPTFGIDRE